VTEVKAKRRPEVPWLGALPNSVIGLGAAQVAGSPKSETKIIKDNAGGSYFVSQRLRS
jgi:hypothetical protein